MKNTQSTLNTIFDFDSSENTLSTRDTLNTSTQGRGVALNPFYTCSCRRGYSLYNDPFNEFRRQENPEDCSRGQIAKIYRLGKWF